MYCWWKFYNLIYIFKINLFIYFWLCWVFVSVRGLSLVAVSGGHSSSRCVGLSLWRPLLLRSTGSRCAGSVVVAHGPSCSAACGILQDQGSNPCPLHWQADSQPLHHQGSPQLNIFILMIIIKILWVWKIFQNTTSSFLFFKKIFGCVGSVAARGLSLVAASRGYSLLRCTGSSLWWLLLLRSTGSRCVGFSSCGMRAQ